MIEAAKGRIYIVIAVAILLVGSCLAQQAALVNPNAMPIDVDRGAAGLSRALASLRTRASIMAVVAHPDDEDGGMLAFETRGLGARGISHDP